MSNLILFDTSLILIDTGLTLSCFALERCRWWMALTHYIIIIIAHPSLVLCNL